MKRLLVATLLTWGGPLLATPATHDDLGGQSGVENEFWDTTGRQPLRVDVASSASATEVSSCVPKAWSFSSAVEIWSTLFGGFHLIFK